MENLCCLFAEINSVLYQNVCVFVEWGNNIFYGFKKKEIINKKKKTRNHGDVIR